MEILENPGKGQKKEARRGQEEAQKRPGRGQEEARKRPEEARKKARIKAPKGQESRIWRKIARNAMFYEQKMTSLGAGEFQEILAQKRPEEAQKRPGEARKRPGRGQEEARKRPGRGQEEARNRPCSKKGPERSGIQNLAKNCSKRNVL